MTPPIAVFEKAPVTPESAAKDDLAPKARATEAKIQTPVCVVEIEPVAAKLSDGALETDPAAAVAAMGGCDTDTGDETDKPVVGVPEALSFTSNIHMESKDAEKAHDDKLSDAALETDPAAVMQPRTEAIPAPAKYRPRRPSAFRKPNQSPRASTSRRRTRRRLLRISCPPTSPTLRRRPTPLQQLQRPLTSGTRKLAKQR